MPSSTIPGEPVLRSLAWSNDNQLLAVTRNALHVHTPAHGLAQALTHSKTFADIAPSSSHNHTNFISTSIPPLAEITWSDITQDISTASFSSFEPTWKCASWSPRGLTDSAGCLLAALNSNYEVFLFSPGQNLVRGKWNLQASLTTSQSGQISSGNNNELDILAIQTTAITWCPNGLLATADRSGGITFWSPSTCHGQMSSPLTRISASSIPNTYITQFAPTINASNKNYVAYSLNNGAVVIMRKSVVSQASSLSPLFDQIPYDVPVWSFPPDGKYVSLVHWHPSLSPQQEQGADSPPQNNLIIIKPGFVHIGDHTIELVRLPIWNGSTIFDPAVGVINLIHHVDSEFRSSFAIITQDSSFFVIKSILNEQNYQLDVESSISLSRNMKIFMSRANIKSSSNRNDSGGNNNNHGFSMSAVVGSSLSGIYCLYSKRKLESLWYLPSSLRECVLSSFVNISLSPIQDIDAHSTLLLDEFFSSILRSSPSLLYQSPMTYLNPIISLLEETKTESTNVYNIGLIAGLVDRLMKTVDELSPTELEDINNNIDNYRDLNTSISSQGQTIPEVSRLVNLMIFSPAYLQALRNVLFLLRHIQQQNLLKTTDLNSNVPSESSLITSVNLVSAKLSFSLFKSIKSILDSFKDSSPFISPDRERILQVLNDRLLHSSATVTSSPTLLSSPFQDTPCPACNSTIQFTDFNSATCSNGHIWDRCSITFKLISSVDISTCEYCGRKAIKPENPSLMQQQNQQISQQTNDSNNNIVVRGGDGDDIVLDSFVCSIVYCMFCGGRWTGL